MHKGIHDNACSHQGVVGGHCRRGRADGLGLLLLHRGIRPRGRNQSAAVVRQDQNQIQDSLSLHLAEDLQLLAMQRMVGTNDSDFLGHLDVGSVT